MHAQRLRSGAAAGSRGMTLIEILVVVAIIGMIVGGVAVMAGSAFSGAQQDTARNNVTKLENLVEMYKVQKKGRCPQTFGDLKTAGIMKKVTKDPWDTPYRLKCDGEHAAIEISSAGADGEFGTADDVNSWDDGSGDEDKDGAGDR